jgi:hypothetical protein
MRIQQLISRTLQRAVTALAVIVTIAGSPALVNSPPVVAAAQTARNSPIEGRWAGFWVSYSVESQGFLYEAALTLAGAADNSVEGQIRWTLRNSPRASEQAKVGLSAVEFVRGSYDPGSRVLRLAGYRKDDPNGVISLDRYHLVLSDNGNVIGGITESHGSWQGVLSTIKRP